MVHEPARKIVQSVYDWKTRETKKETIRVPEGKRRFLVGMDECHLFIAQMDDKAGATSIKQAHEALRPSEVPSGRQFKKQKVKRTGEWFLLPATAAEIVEINEEIKNLGSRKKVGIGGTLGRMRGRPPRPSAP